MIPICHKKGTARDESALGKTPRSDDITSLGVLF